MAKKPKHQSDTLTETELEMMQIIWRIGPCTVNQMLDELPKDRPLAYTSVSTIVRILEQKGFVASMKEGRGHAYVAKVRKEDYQARSIDHLVTNVFDGAPTALVRRLVDGGALSATDLNELRDLLNKKGS